MLQCAEHTNSSVGRRDFSHALRTSTQLSRSASCAVQLFT